MTASKYFFRTEATSVAATSVVSSLLTVQTSGAGFTDITAEVAKFLADARAREGAVTLFVRHTSASLTIQENADPTVLVDLTTALQRLAPENAGWRHDTEGPDDMPAHIKTMLTATSLHVPVLGRALALGTWQAIYLIEHRRAAAPPRGGAAIRRRHELRPAKAEAGRELLRGRLVVRARAGACGARPESTW